MPLGKLWQMATRLATRIAGPMPFSFRRDVRAEQAWKAIEPYVRTIEQCCWTKHYQRQRCGDATVARCARLLELAMPQVEVHGA